MYQLEKSIKGFLLSTLNVRDLSDIRRTALKAANKDIAVDLAMTCLKSKQLRSQSKLLKVQEELSVKKSAQLDAVKTTVKKTCLVGLLLLRRIIVVNINSWPTKGESQCSIHLVDEVT